MGSGAPVASDAARRRTPARVLGRLVLGAFLAAGAVWILVDLDHRAGMMAHEALHQGTGFAPPSVTAPTGVASRDPYDIDGGVVGESFTIQVVSATQVDSPEVRVFRDREECGGSVWPYASGGGPAGLSEAIVWIEGITRGAEGYPTTVVMSNSGCAMWPHVATAPVGSSLTLQSYAYGAEVFRVTVLDGPRVLATEQIALSAMDTNLWTPQEQTVALDTRGLVRVQSLLRPWEIGHVLVHAGTYAMVTDWEGKAWFMSVPRGTYTLHAWHPLVGEVTQPLTVDAAIGGGTVTVGFP